MADLSVADLSGVDLNGANLSGANLSEVDFNGADLRMAKLIKNQALINIKECMNIWSAVTTQATLEEQNIFDDERQALQAQGLIILVESTAPNNVELYKLTWLICCDNITGEKTIHNILWLDLDLAATEQLNPQWTFEIITQPK